MDQTKLRREDFSYEANNRGYMLMYKGQSIGGAGSFTGGVTTTDINEDKQTQDFINSAEIDIQNIVFGNPGRYAKSIDEINNR